MGYAHAGFTEILGVDNEPQPNYPFTFIQADALDFMDAMIDGRENIAYDLIHASPPCQRWSVARHSDNHPDLIRKTQERLSILSQQYVIENVPQAPLVKDLMLCGSMFGMEIRRHRVFELSFSVNAPPFCNHQWENPKAPFLVAGHGGGWSEGHKNYYNFPHAQDLMYMPWAGNRKEIIEAVPPPYTRWIGHQFAKNNPPKSLTNQLG